MGFLLTAVVAFCTFAVMSRFFLVSPCDVTYQSYYWLYAVGATLFTPLTACVIMEAYSMFLTGVAIFMCQNILVALWIGTRWAAECYDTSVAMAMRSGCVFLVNSVRVSSCWLMQYRVEFMEADLQTLRIMRGLLCLITLNMLPLLFKQTWLWSIISQAVLYPIFLACTLRCLHRVRCVVRQSKGQATKLRRVEEARLVEKSLQIDALAFTANMVIATVANVFWLKVVRHSPADSVPRYVNVGLTFTDILLNHAVGVALSSVFTGAKSAGRQARKSLANRRRTWREAAHQFHPRSDARWNEKVMELAGRGVTLEKLLDFYDTLGGEHMPWFDPFRSTTCDVVRGAIIPISSTDKVAMATLLMDGRYTKPHKMVTHCWTNLFSDLVAAILADALREDEFERIKMQLITDPTVLRQWVGRRGLKRTYWICSFAVNQHCTICDTNRHGLVDTVTRVPYQPCECGCKKYWNSTAPLMDGRGIYCEANKFDEMVRFLSATDSTFGQVVAIDAEFDLFTRAWCVAEIHAANTAGMPQQLKIESPEKLDERAEDLRQIKIEAMKASRPEDKQQILDKIPDKQAFNDHLQTLLFKELLPAWADFNRLQMAVWIGRFVRWERVQARADMFKSPTDVSVPSAPPSHSPFPAVQSQP